MPRVVVPEWARRDRTTAQQRHRSADAAVHVAIVGVCASGKSSLAARLREDGYTVSVVAQEHSEIPHLWALSEPDVLIYLSADLATVRQRRNDPAWPATLFTTELARLQLALSACDVYINTRQYDREGVARVARLGIQAATGHLYDTQ